MRFMTFPCVSIRAGGLVHSFTGSVEEMQALVDLGFYIGINGCQ